MKKLTTTLATSIALFGLAGITGCEQAQESADNAKAKTESTLNKVAEESKKMADSAGEHIDAAAASAKEKINSVSGSEHPEGEAHAASAEHPAGDNANPMLDEDKAQGAVAILYPTAGNEVRGTVHFRPSGNNLTIDTTATSLSPGEHGYHVHIYGDCAAPDGTSAGTHFNFEGSSLNPPEDIGHITGNLGTLMADQNGNAEHSAEIENATLSGPKSIIGRAVIVHAKANDPAQPPIGAAGSRVACGVIGIADPAASP